MLMKMIMQQQNMNMELEILSKEIIRPSSSSICSHHLKSFKLSVLDQLAPLTYTSLIFFYKKPANSDQLKSSLSETLTKYYLLAGRIKDDQIICSDEGAIFVEARVSISMPEFLLQPRSELLSQLIPCRSVCTEYSSEVYPQVAIQLNSFTCGGVAVAACFLHKIIDGTSLSAFLRCWAAVARGSSDEAMGCSDYRAVSSLFPPRDQLSNSISWLSRENSPFLCRGKNCIRRFVFEAPAILDLKAQAKTKSVPNPTPVEVVTAFIWKYAIKAARDRSGSQQPSVLTHAVDLRRRMSPSMPTSAVGNIFWSALAYYNSQHKEIEIKELVNLLRASFQEIEKNYIEKMKGEEGFESIWKSLTKIQELYSKKQDAYGFTSWRKMGLNEVDFGWGKPSWVSFAGLANSILRNIVILKETSLGDGVEAWVILDQEEMNLLENNQQFLAFASLNPSVHLA